MHGEKLIGRPFLIHISRLLKQKLTLPLYQHYPNPFLIKQRRKSDNLSPNGFFGRRKNLSPYISLYRVSWNICPVVIPQIFAQTQGSYYRQLIHFGSSWGKRVIAMLSLSSSRGLGVEKKRDANIVHCDILSHTSNPKLIAIVNYASSE